MGQTKGGGIRNMAESLDDTKAELTAEVRKRIIAGGGYGDITATD